MKRTVCFLLCLLLTICSVMPVQAAESRAVAATPSLTFSDQMANCSVQVVSAGDSIVVHMQLWYGNVCLGTWHGTGASAVTVSQPVSVQSGNVYTLKVFGTVNDVAFTCAPISKKCP